VSDAEFDFYINACAPAMKRRKVQDDSHVVTVDKQTILEYTALMNDFKPCGRVPGDTRAERRKFLEK